MIWYYLLYDSNHFDAVQDSSLYRAKLAYMAILTSNFGILNKNINKIVEISKEEYFKKLPSIVV